MIRSEVEELLRLRWNLTGERFSNETVEAWEPVLRTLGYSAAKEALYLAASRTDRVTLRAFEEARPPEPREVTNRRTNAAGECLHPDAEQGSSCPDCREYLPTWEQGYLVAVKATDEERARIAARRGP